VLDGRAPSPPAYKVTATSVANKGEPFRSGLSDSKNAVQDFMDTVTGAGEAVETTQVSMTGGDSLQWVCTTSQETFYAMSAHTCGMCHCMEHVADQ
jgi:hypothetical protein